MNKDTISIGWLDDNKHVNSFEHYHNAYEIALFLDADIEITINNISYHMQKNCLAAIDRYVTHQFTYSPMPYKRYMLNSTELFGTLVPTIFFNPYFFYQLNSEDAQKLQVLFRCAHENISDNISTESLYYSVGTLLTEINKLSYQPLAANERKLSDTLIHNVIQYINNNYMSPLTLQETAAYFFVDHHYLCRKFKSVCGYTFVDYLQFRRITEAQKMLQDGHKINDILSCCGFENQQHFYRVFKKKVGCTPKQYLKNKHNITTFSTMHKHSFN